MRTIITGGTGLIGRALAESLVADGHTVVVLSRFPERATGLPTRVQVEGWDGATANGWLHVADGADAIVNLAGANLAGEHFLPSRWTEARKRLIRESRVNTGRAVVDAVKRMSQKPGVVIQASGVGYYGFHGDEELGEDAPAGDDFGARLAAEEWEPSTEPVEELGVRRVIIRTGAVLDANEGALPRLMLPFRLFVGGYWGSGKQWLSWIHPEDEVRAIRFLMEDEEARGAFNLTAPGAVTNAGLGKALGKVMRRPYWFPIPGFALRWTFGEVTTVLLKGQRAVPERLLALGFAFRFPDVTSALRDLLK
jgi:uncharacterized protein (TIGR01777 family)